MFSIVDVIFLILILIVALAVTAKGFLKEIFNKASWILSILFGVMFYSKLDIFVSEFVHVAALSKILSFLLIFVAVFLLIKIIQTIVGKIFEGEILRGLDRALGLLLGIVEGLGIIFLIIYILYVQPWFPIDALFEGSFFYKIFSSLLPSVSNSISTGAA